MSWGKGEVTKRVSGIPLIRIVSRFRFTELPDLENNTVYRGTGRLKLLMWMPKTLEKRVQQQACTPVWQLLQQGRVGKLL